ncbi:Src homology-3 domain [Macleaya cordata]|uniref:Src homology-3 domain n=1 Tax=Macleaya cordata TaxID=56857 RepID=A0A200R6P4_MACCD|nr:Src homology-3 domain [Macleaya cordata]
MEAIRKQASKLREQVAKQQQAVLRQLGHFGNDGVVVDEAEIQCHQQLQNLYNSTRVAKHFQRNIVRGVENFISTSSKQMEIVRKLAEDCCRYGNENHSSSYALANASLQFGNSHKSMEEERENLIRIFDAQVSEPLRASIVGAPLDDARHLTHRYDRIRQEVDTQAAEVTRRQLKSKEAGASSENSVKLQYAEAKLAELKSTMMALGREAMAAMLSVEDQQQQLTFQRLLTMVNAERAYHHSAADILEKLHAEMIVQKQKIESESQPETLTTYVHVPPGHSENDSYKSGDVEPDTPKDTSFIAEVMHPFDAQADGELSLSVGDYIVVRQVTSHGWSEGECMGKSGWFPTAYIEKRDKAPVSKVTELNNSLP